LPEPPSSDKSTCWELLVLNIKGIVDMRRRRRRRRRRRVGVVVVAHGQGHGV